MSNLADAFTSDFRNADAEALYKRALEGYRKRGGKVTHGLAVCLANYAHLQANQHRYPEAEAGYREALRANEESLGPEHLDSAMARNQLAYLLMEENKPAEAQEMAGPGPGDHAEKRMERIIPTRRLLMRPWRKSPIGRETSTRP